MPQMAPLWWLTLMFLFTLSYIMMSNYIYFYKSYSKKSSGYKTEIKMLNWKW
uniref:ATP synthase complex subunit 8 n=2 Tax=Helotrephes TaxID=1250272 RepID=A0A059TCH9_9HEMI|nr:ATP synthase F0 subunit 8 [Helotrephes sp. NKMT027]ACJ69563.1 ATP synthase F0 subunit 8 [Helotrephes sp. NKMT027]AHX42579.1 ATP synthase F0 subunit 8 [Helotrephes semiglobosus semiglobosus]